MRPRRNVHNKLIWDKTESKETGFRINRSLKEGFAALPSETVGLDTPVYDFGSCFLELLPADPHLLEGLQ
jgi:hypothetical protein